MFGYFLKMEIKCKQPKSDILHPKKMIYGPKRLKNDRILLLFEPRLVDQIIMLIV